MRGRRVSQTKPALLRVLNLFESVATGLQSVLDKIVCLMSVEGVATVLMRGLPGVPDKACCATSCAKLGMFSRVLQQPYRVSQT